MLGAGAARAPLISSRRWQSITAVGSMLTTLGACLTPRALAINAKLKRAFKLVAELLICIGQT
jgi:hypothetical protein